MTNMIAFFLTTFQLIALVALIALIIVWVMMRKRG